MSYRVVNANNQSEKKITYDIIWAEGTKEWNLSYFILNKWFSNGG